MLVVPSLPPSQQCQRTEGKLLLQLSKQVNVAINCRFSCCFCFLHVLLSVLNSHFIRVLVTVCNFMIHWLVSPLYVGIFMILWTMKCIHCIHWTKQADERTARSSWHLHVTGMSSAVLLCVWISQIRTGTIRLKSILKVDPYSCMLK